MTIADRLRQTADTIRAGTATLVALAAERQSGARWRSYVVILALGTVLAFVGLVAFISVVDPWKALPISARIERDIQPYKQRLFYPMLVRSGRYDSFIFGSSTGMLLDPENFKSLGGRFLQLGLTNGMAWEQLELLQLIRAEVAEPRVLIFTIDWVWCVPGFRRETAAVRQFPFWIYQKRSWINIVRLLNIEALRDSWTTIRHNWRRRHAYVRDDGYWMFTPPDETYDLASALKRIYNSDHPRLLPPIVPPQYVSEYDRAAWTFPYLDQLEDELARLPGTRKLFVTMPVHVIAQPQPGSVEAQREETCKQRIARIAAKHGSILMDFRIASDVTRMDSNYWDPLHYRLPIARSTEASVVAAARSQRSDPAGFWRVIDAR